MYDITLWRVQSLPGNAIQALLSFLVIILTALQLSDLLCGEIH